MKKVNVFKLFFVILVFISFFMTSCDLEEENTSTSLQGTWTRNVGLGQSYIFNENNFEFRSGLVPIKGTFTATSNAITFITTHQIDVNDNTLWNEVNENSYSLQGYPTHFYNLSPISYRIENIYGILTLFINNIDHKKQL